MFPLNPLAYRHELAQATDCEALPFARAAGLGEDAGGARAILPAAQFCLNCYPSPNTRPGPLRVGPFFRLHKCNFWQVSANRPDHWNFHFQAVGNALESAAITTIDRGSEPCINQSFSLPRLPCPLRAACRIPRRAALPVRPVARCWQISLTRTSSPVRRLAGLPGLRAAESRSACRPATDAPRGTIPRNRPSGHPARVAFCHARKAR